MYRVIVSAKDYTLPWEEKEQWLRDNLGYSVDKARDTVYALEGYTDRGYHDIHMQNFEGYHGDATRKDAEDIDDLLHHPKMKKYHGTCYRGLKWSQFKFEELEDLLNSGIWKEPGITSFSVDESDASKFAVRNSLYDAIHITLRNSKSGCEIGFLSAGGGEGEVLFPSDVCRRGFKILDWNKKEHLSQRKSRKTGEVQTVVYARDYYITCTE